MWKNHAENMHQKLFPHSILILVNNPKQPWHPRIFQGRLSKSLKKVILFVLFWTQSLLMDKILKKKGPGSSDQSPFRLQIKFRKNSFLVIYYLTKFDYVISSGFWVIPKITSANLCKPIHDKIFHSHLSFWI